jgi:predicted O-linked N-acetylglucosamine transferase (SPINDLY family)
LKIGYVSPDFRTHPIGRFMLPLLKAHDRKQFEIYCYSGTRFPDEVTSALRQHADIWHDAPNLSDPALANLIHRDRIDILVDLTMHMVHNRLLVFARKPAPIQITYLAYPGTTGLQAIDYRITDPYLDPPGMDEAVYSERTIRLPRSYWCYEPGLEAALDVAPVPLLRNGFITFGCQNNYCKISPQAWNAWQRILSAVPQSRLLVYTPPGDHRDTARQILADAGIDPSRLLFSESRNIDYFRCYNRIDIALDSFPYVGGTTTCDALWMGVPVVTLAGRMASGRGGVSILTNIGLPDLIARTPEEYVAIAVALAADLPRLERLRSTMRDRMRNSPLMDPSPFAASMESIYRQVWREWCSNGREPS